jgi:hypothetical protein
VIKENRPSFSAWLCFEALVLQDGRFFVFSTCSVSCRSRSRTASPLYGDLVDSVKCGLRQQHDQC